MMYPVSEENYREVHGEEEVNIPNYMEQIEDKVYLHGIILFISLY